MRKTTPPHHDFDVIIAGDLSVEGDHAFRLALETRHYHRAGCRVGLLHIRSVANDRPIAREIAACTRRGFAKPVTIGTAAATRLAILHSPAILREAVADLSPVVAEKLILVAHSSADYDIRPIVARLPQAAETRWAAVSRAIRKAATEGLKHTRAMWLPPQSNSIEGTSNNPAAAPAIGWILSHGEPDLPSVSPSRVEIFAISQDGHRPALLDDLHILDLAAGEIALGRLVRGLDALAHFPESTVTDLPDALILTALREGKPVALSPWLKSRYGSGPIYCSSEQALRNIMSLLKDAGAVARHADRTRRAAREEFGSGLPVVASPARSAPPETTLIRPIIFFAGGGTGLGHVTRLLAIARRLDPRIPVLFVCQAHAVSAIEKFGYTAEYIPPASSVGGSDVAWNKWLAFRLEHLVDDYDPSLVVFDGNHLYPGLVRVVGSRPDCRLAWVRRGMWGKTFSRFMANARWCDMIIEPGELPGQPDDGATAKRRNEVTRVNPVTLLDRSELLGRSAAAEVLGLDPNAPAVLLQLGVNSTRETVSLIEPILRELRRHPKLQVCLAEFSGIENDVGYWPGVTYVRGFPLSQYLRAFDFAISAAGYNTFHEAVGFALPTIFIPNRHPSMDDQAGRADFAQSSGAAFCLDDSLGDLPELIRLLLEPKGRAYLIESSERMSGPNGASTAAEALGRIAQAVAA